MQTEKSTFEMLCITVALEMGILPFEYKPNDVFPNMDADESRKMKRKFRKLKNKAKKKLQLKGTHFSKSSLTASIERDVRSKAHNILRKSDN
jgi:hypothetical protein